jgi:DNA-binding NarL/FixJ family response regulator
MAGSGLLLEREAELETLAAAVKSVAAGDGAFVAVLGGPGAGKTRLLAEARRLAASAGMLVLPARACELAQDFAFGVARQLFEPVLAQADAPQRRRLLAGAAGQAASVLGQDGADAEPVGAFAVLHGLFWLTTNLGQRQPVALVCDDVHWADESTLRFLAYLMPRLEGLAVLVVCALRPGYLGHSGQPSQHGEPARLLERLTADAACTVLTPPPLRLTAASVLLQDAFGGRADPVFVLACHQAAGGNPLLLQELARAAGTAGLAPVAENARQVVRLGGHAVARRVELWLAKFPADRLALVRAVAVLGSGASLADAARLAGLDHQNALDAADDLQRADILRQGGGADDGNPAAGGPVDAVAFMHPLVQAAVYDQLPPAERGASHRAAADMLIVGGAPAERVAAHLRHVAELDERALATLRRAAREALGRGAPDVALAHLRLCLDQTTEPGDRLELLVQAGRAAAQTDVPAAVPLFDEALRLATDPLQRADIAYRLGHVWFVMARWQPAHELYLRALDWLPAGDDDLRRRLLAGLVLFEHGYVDPAIADPPGLIDPLRNLPPADTMGSRMLDCMIAQYEYLTGDPRAVERAVRGVGDGYLIERGDSDLAVASALQVLAAADRAETMPSVNAVVARAYETGSGSTLVYALGIRGLFWLWRGELAEAVADQRAMIQAASIAGRGIFYRFFLPWLVVALVEQGQQAEAATVLDDIGAPDPLPPSGPWFHYLSARAVLLRAEGRAEEALDAALAAGRYLEMQSAPNPAFEPWRSEAALCLHTLGREPEARALAAEELGLAMSWPSPRAQGRAQRVLGLLTKGADGLGLLHAAVDTLRASTARLEYAKALGDLGGVLRRGGHAVQARTHLHRALDLADALGAAGLAGQMREELRAAGARPRRTALSGPASLTPSELRVAELAASGHTNRDIAQQLFVTSKTVEVHLSSAYRKLDITRRDQLAVALRPPGKRQAARSP